jgi:hypothetical protein
VRSVAALFKSFVELLWSYQPTPQEATHVSLTALLYRW